MSEQYPVLSSVQIFAIPVPGELESLNARGKFTPHFISSFTQGDLLFPSHSPHELSPELRNALQVQDSLRTLQTWYQNSQLVGLSVSPWPIPEDSLEATLIQQILLRRSAEVRLKKIQLHSAIFSHEMKNPLAAALPLIELLVQKIQSQNNPEAGILASRIQRLTLRILSLVYQNIEYTNPEKGALPLLRKKADLVQLLHNSIDDFLGKNTDQLELHVPEHLYAEVDPLHFESVVVNLLSNAKKYAPQSPIKICLQPVDEQIVLEIKDDGPGIPPEDREKILTPYFRSRRSPSTAIGHGLGLYWVDRVMKAHQGSFQLAPSPRGCHWRCIFPQKPTQRESTAS